MTFKEYVINDLSQKHPNYKFTGRVFGGGLGHEAFTRGKTPRLVFPEASSEAISRHIHERTAGIYSAARSMSGTMEAQE